MTQEYTKRFFNNFSQKTDTVLLIIVPSFDMLNLQKDLLYIFPLCGLTTIEYNIFLIIYWI